jgi:hypothetical protein
LGVEAVRPSESRLRALLEALVGLNSELSLDALLQRLVEVAAELIGRTVRRARRDRPQRSAA